MYCSPDLYIQHGVLEHLGSSINLKKLRINGCGATVFPNWVSDSSFGNIVSLNINFYDNCSLLPPIGRLHSLKKLYIERMTSVKTDGTEFYGINSWPSF